jgi:hypothetical protein
MAKSFKLVGTHAISVLARLAARNIIKEQLRDQGVRVSLVPIRDITEKGSALSRRASRVVRPSS